MPILYLMFMSVLARRFSGISPLKLLFSINLFENHQVVHVNGELLMISLSKILNQID